MLSAPSNFLLTEPDVLIVGAGSAGIAAAAGAAQAGARVTLLEKNGYPGGKATGAFVGTVCGLYFRSENPAPRWVQGGFPKIFAEQLQERSGTAPVLHKNGLHFLPYERFAFLRLCDELAGQHAESFGLHAHVCRASREADRVVSVEALVYHRTVVFRPKTIIDTSGEAVLAQLLEADKIESDEYQASAQVFQLAGLPPVDAQQLALSLLRSIRKGLSDGTFPSAYERLSVVPGSVQNGRAVFKLGIPLRVGNDPLDVSKTELFARQAVEDIVRFLRTNNDVFQHSWLAMLAPETGIRTGPRHRGRYVLAESDVLECRKQADGIARGAWPIEHWEPGKDPRMTWFAPDDYYDIPAGALQSGSLSNLFFAGRTLSASDAAIASARVIGTCLATGYAAGRLAAGQVNRESAQDSITAIRQSLFGKIP